METAVLILFAIPFGWSAMLAALRRMADVNPSHQLPDDKSEKRFLTLILLPVLLGIAIMLAGRFVPMHLPLPEINLGPGDDGGDMAGVLASVPSDRRPFDWLRLTAKVTVVLYAAGALPGLARLTKGFIRLGHLVSRSRQENSMGAGVRVIDASIPPLAWGQHTILLPRNLIAVLSEPQLRLVLSHEREHLKRGDSRWFAMLAWIDAIFWFNPFVRAQTGRCRLAAELACDAAVLGAVPEMRETYAETLVKVLKHAAGDVRQYAPAAFSPEKSGDYRMRITQIMHPGPALRKPRLLLTGLVAGLVVPVVAAQFAWAQTAVSAAHNLTTLPMESDVTSGFGMRINPVTHKPLFHPGIDFKAHTGTPVKAAGDGIVTKVYSEPYHMGEVIEIDHGNGLQTRYAHLGTQDVKVGDTVKAGQHIATSGNSGVTTGPHMHFEVWNDGKAIDPASVLPLQKPS